MLASLLDDKDETCLFQWGMSSCQPLWVFFFHLGLGVSLESDSLISFLRFIIKAATFWEQMGKGTEDFDIQTGDFSLNSSFHYGTHGLPQPCRLSSKILLLFLSVVVSYVALLICIYTFCLGWNRGKEVCLSYQI